MRILLHLAHRRRNLRCMLSVLSDEMFSVGSCSGHEQA